MPPMQPAQRHTSTTSTSAAESNVAPTSRKRKRTDAKATQANTSKRVKTETSTPTDSKVTKSVAILSDPIYDTIVEFKVGESLVSFGVHRGLLQRTLSSFNEQLATSEINDGGVVAQCIVMKNEEPEVFRRFSFWLYSENIISESEKYKDLPWGTIIEVYSFGERYGISRLQNKCVDTVIKKIKAGGLFPSQTDINSLWRRSGNFFRLRRLLLDLFASGCKLTQAMQTTGSYHVQFLEGPVTTLYESKVQGTINDPIDFWQKRRNYYVDDSQNPILVD